MASQKKVSIINVQRSSTGKLFKQTIMESIWLKKEAKLKDDGWLLEDDIKEIKTEEVDDGKGINTVVIEEEEVTDSVPDLFNEEKDFSEMNKAELQAVCDKKGIKYHHATKKENLIKLLEA